MPQFGSRSPTPGDLAGDHQQSRHSSSLQELQPAIQTSEMTIQPEHPPPLRSVSDSLYAAAAARGSSWVTEDLGAAGSARTSVGAMPPSMKSPDYYRTCGFSSLPGMVFSGK